MESERCYIIIPRARNFLGESSSFLSVVSLELVTLGNHPPDSGPALAKPLKNGTVPILSLVLVLASVPCLHHLLLLPEFHLSRGPLDGNSEGVT